MVGQKTGIAIAAIALTCTLALGGCGQGAQVEESAADSSPTTTSPEPTPEPEPAPTLDPAELGGYWMVTPPNPEETGMLCVFWFDDSGIFKTIVRAQDAVLEREGIYTIKGEEALVSLPEYKSAEVENGPITSLSAKAVADCRVTISGNTLTAHGFGTDGSNTTAKKITDAQYQEYSDVCAAMGPKHISIGETVTTDVATFTVNSISYVDEIYPPDTSGYYQYYEDEDDSTYLLASVTYTNTGTDYSIPGYATAAAFKVAGNNYDATVEFTEDGTMGINYRVEAKDTAQFYIWCSVPDSVVDSGAIELTWQIPSEQNYMNTFFKESYPHDTFTLEA